MKTINKILIVIFLLLFQVSFCQNSSDRDTGNPNEAYPYILGERNFETIKKEGLEFYKNKIEIFGIDKVATEGSPYINFTRFISDWEIKLANHDYNLKQYFASLDSKSDYKDMPIEGCEWEEFGPLVKSSGSQSNPNSGSETRINGIGHTEFIRIDKNDPSKMLVGSAFGGLFYSRNAGDLWTCVSDNWDTSAVAWAEFSETNPGTIVAVATRGGDLNGKSHFLGVDGGILISRDYGQSWDKLITTSILSDWDKVNKVIFNPDKPEEIFIAKSNGLYKYTNINDLDNPNNLEEVFVPSSTNGFSSIECLDVEIITSDELFLDGNFFATSFLVTENFAGGNVTSVKTYVTQNGWQASQEVFNSINKEAATFEYSPSNLFPGADPYKAKIHCNIKTGSSKQVWSLRLFNLSEEMLKTENEGSQNFGSSFGFAVNPFDEKKIIYSYKLGLSGTNNGFANNSGNPTNGELHDDKEHFLWHPTNPDEVWVAHHGGVSKSINNGLDWESKDLGLGVAMVQKFDHSEYDLNKILLSLDHDGTTRLNSSYNQSNLTHDWNMFSGISDGVGATMIDKDEYQFYFASGQFGSTNYVAIDYNAASQGLSFPSAYGNAAYNGWYEPAQNGTVVYTHGIENSVNFGNVYKTELTPGVIPTTRTRISDFTQFIPNGNDLILTQIGASQKDDNILFANGLEIVPIGNSISLNQVLFYCNKANNVDAQVAINSWTEVQMPYDNGQSVNYTAFGSVKESHYIDGRYYLTTSGNANLYRAVMLDIDNQNNMTFTDITGDLPNCGAKYAQDYNITIEKGTNEGIYVAQDCGVYYLHGSDLNSGNFNWTLIGSGLPNIEKRGIKPYYALNKLRVGTFGRGLWEGCFVCPEDEIFYESGVYSDPYVFKEARQEIHSIATVQVEQNVKYRAGDFIDLNPRFQAKHGSIFDAFIHPCEPNRSNSFKSERANPWEPLSQTLEGENNIILKQSSEGIALYPNPTSSIINLETSFDAGAFELYDIHGKIMTQDLLQSTTTIIDLSKFSTGVYFLTIRSDSGEVHFRKVIKE